MKTYQYWTGCLIGLVGFILAATAGAGETDGFIRNALDYNQEIRNAMADVRAAEAEVEKTYGMFDLKLGGDLAYTKMINDPEAGLFGTEETGVLTYGLSLSEKLITAGILSVDFTKSETRNVYSPEMLMFYAAQGSEPLNPTHQPELSLMYTQPLLKGFLGRPDMTAIRIGDLSIAMAQENVLLLVQDKVEEINDALINIAMSQSVLKLQESSLASNLRYYQQAVRMRKIGLREEKDLLQTEASMLSAKAQIRPAENNIATAKEGFTVLTGVPAAEEALAAYMDPRQVAETCREMAVEPSLSDEAVNELVQRQPTVRVAGLAIEMAKLSKRITENSAWPELNLFGKYGLTGTEGDSGSSFSELFSNDYPSYTVGLNFTVYLPNRDNSGDLKGKVQALSKSEESLKALVSAMRMQVRTAHRNLLAAEEDFALKQQIREAYEKSLAIHNRHFGQGRISARELLLAESEYQMAKLSEVQSLYVLAKAVNAWKKITGNYQPFGQALIKEQ